MCFVVDVEVVEGHFKEALGLIEDKCFTVCASFFVMIGAVPLQPYPWISWWPFKTMHKNHRRWRI